MFFPTHCLKTKEVDDTENRKWHINNLSAQAVCSNPTPVVEVSYKYQTSCGMEIGFLLLILVFLNSSLVCGHEWRRRDFKQQNPAEE